MRCGSKLYWLSFVLPLWSLCLCGELSAQTSYPMITHATPVALERGKTAEVLVEGQMDFTGIYKALFEGTGLSAEILEVPPPPKGARRPSGSAKLKITVAPDAALGVREFRLASNLGLSSVGQLLIVDAPVMLETEPNNTQDKSNAVSAPAVVCGQLGQEDLDYFKVHAEAGQTLTCEVFCARLQDKIHDLQKHADPILTLFDADGRELAANDDFYFADPLLSYTVAKSGDYFVQVRDSKYDGDRRWVYALRITTGPYVTNVFPLAGSAGETIEVETVGTPAGARTNLVAPAELGLHSVQLEVGGVKTNPAAFLVSSLPTIREQEPNDTPEQATRIALPCCINGRIGQRRDLDHFAFAARKDKPIRFEVKSRRFGTVLQSSLDSMLEVMTPQGKVLASNDDAIGKDSALVFMPPADGDYVLRIRDLNSKGGDNYVYAIEADWAPPDFTLRCDPDKAMIGPGSSTAWYVHVTRLHGFAGPVKAEVKGLPAGVSASPLTIPPEMTQGVIVLTAAPDATRDATVVQVEGSASVKRGDSEEAIARSATPNEEIYLPGGGRGRFDVHLQAVAVTGPSDILTVEVKPDVVTLKPGEEVRLDVTIQRRPEYDKDVTIDVVLSHLGGVFGNPLPPGVTVVDGKSKTALRAGANQGHIVLKAAPTAAPIDNVPISVLAHVSINFVVKVSYASAPIPVSVHK